MNAVTESAQIRNGAGTLPNDASKPSDRGVRPEQASLPPTCCGAETTLLQSIGIDELRTRPSDLENAIRHYSIFDAGMTGIAAMLLLHSLGEESGSHVSIFQCSLCGRLDFRIDQI